MNVKQLMRKFEGLDYHERVVLLTDLGRSLDAEACQGLLEALGQGDTYQRSLALHLARSKRRVVHIERALADPSLSVRAFAAKLFARHADVVPAELLDRLDRVSLAAIRLELCRRQRTHAPSRGSCRRTDRARAAGRGVEHAGELQSELDRRAPRSSRLAPCRLVPFGPAPQ